jgi:hypothetical protein
VYVVSYPWEKDPKGLPDNRQQAMQSLEATESRLERNPEHAKAYDTQIMEMNDLNFARKLEEKEINDYNGPIHYIAHHSVVKSQSNLVLCVPRSLPQRLLAQKGPDLLNNLFGVILRFRENKVALSAESQRCTIGC